MLLIKYLLQTLGLGSLVIAVAILLYGLYHWVRHERTGEGTEKQLVIPWRTAGRLTLFGLIPLLLGFSVTVVPSGTAAVVVSQISGTLPHSLSPGMYWIWPFVQRVELYDARDVIFSTRALADPKQTEEVLSVQTREGLSVGLGVTVRYRLDPARLAAIHSALPQPLGREVVPPVVASVFRQVAPNFMVRELFSTRRGEALRQSAEAISRKLAEDGILVKEVLVRDIHLPPEYAKGLEGLLIKEQENERLAIEVEVKQKLVRTAELEAEAQKARQIKQAEAEAQTTVLRAKAQADAMQHTLPLKEKQIQQSRLEAEARKEATVKNAEAAAQAKVIDSKAELERQKLLAEADDHRIRLLAAADAERLKREAQVLKENPLLIQKIIAERLSDKVQIMMVPTDGKFFFANDVLRNVPLVSAASDSR
ncbi:MAG: SPFH domain-containing protein [Acidobacteriota bacterium]